MENAIKITGGKVDKESLNSSVDGIVKILGACLEHRDKEVTIAALSAIANSLDTSVSHLHFENVSITGADTGVNVSEEKE